jgi:hypothetical protein
VIYLNNSIDCGKKQKNLKLYMTITGMATRHLPKGRGERNIVESALALLSTDGSSNRISKLARIDYENDPFYQRARGCGAVTVTANGVYFHD